MLTRRLLTAISCFFLIGLLGAISVQAQERNYIIRGSSSVKGCLLALIRSGMELHAAHALQEGRRDLVVIESKLKHRYIPG